MRETIGRLSESLYLGNELYPIAYKVSLYNPTPQSVSARSNQTDFIGELVSEYVSRRGYQSMFRPAAHDGRIPIFIPQTNTRLSLGPLVLPSVNRHRRSHVFHVPLQGLSSVQSSEGAPLVCSLISFRCNQSDQDVTTHPRFA
jgi:hypothetical protein